MQDNFSLWNSWEFVLPPNRPGEVEVGLLHALLVGLGGGRAAVLGATPEYRNVFHDHGFEVTVFERNRPFLEMASRHVPRSHEETVVEGNWLDTLSQSEGRFDVVASDFTIGNVPSEQYDSFQRTIAGLLRQGGLLFDRVLHYRCGLTTVAQLRGTFAHSPINLSTANTFNAMAIFRSPTVRMLGNVDATRAYEYIARYVPDVMSLASFTAETVTPRGVKWSYTGEYRNPLTTYRHVLSGCREIQMNSNGFSDGVSVVVGRR